MSANADQAAAHAEAEDASQSASFGRRPEQFESSDGIVDGQRFVQALQVTERLLQAFLGVLGQGNPIAQTPEEVRDERDVADFREVASSTFEIVRNAEDLVQNDDTWTAAADRLSDVRGHAAAVVSLELIDAVQQGHMSYAG